LIKAVIFDRDGVLVQFDATAATSFFHSLIPISIDELAERWDRWGQTVGFPANLVEEANFWRGFWGKLGQDLALPDDVHERLQRVDYTDFLRPYPDARPALLQVRQNGLRAGVLTNLGLSSLNESLQAAGLADLVEVARAAPVAGAAKPEPAAYLNITQALGVEPEACIFFDDEELYVAGAERVGMSAYLVDRSRPDHDLSNKVVRDLSAVSQVLALAQSA